MSKTDPKPLEGEDATQVGVEKQDMMRLQAPEDCTGISIRGMEFAVPASGIVEAPAAVAMDLLSHGFTPVKGTASGKKRAAVA